MKYEWADIRAQILIRSYARFDLETIMTKLGGRNVLI